MSASSAKTTYPRLPCFPCPHDSACCAYGSMVTEKEAAQIQRFHGKDTVFKTRWGEWRTRVKNKRCVFMKDGGCSIHSKPYYPAVCRGFPWTDAETGGPYLFERTICPEFVKRPALVRLGLPSDKSA